MTRVSENSSHTSIQYSINKAKQKLEDLQIRGSTLKSMSRPSDNPVGNVEALNIGAITSDNTQYLRNSDFALLQLNITEQSLEQLTDVLVKAKEIAIGQASDIHNEGIRKNIANEVIQLKNLALSIANKRVGNKYIFGGFNTLQTPFTAEGKYQGDRGHINLEVSKDFFIPINLHGEEVFYGERVSSSPTPKFNPLEQLKPSAKNSDEKSAARSVAQANEGDAFENRENIFGQLTALIAALENSTPEVVQNLLEKFDDSISRLITMRTRVGSLTETVTQSKTNIDSENIDHAQRKSQIVDADITELFSDISKQQQVLKTTYQTSKDLMNQNLLSFLR